MYHLELNHEHWMHYALWLARCAWNNGEVPIGAVLVHNNQVIGKGWNSPIKYHDPTAHAEIIALRQGGSMLQNYRILNTTLYVTLEPCMMCFGAIIHSRISSLVYGAYNEKNRGVRSLVNILLKYRNINFQIHIVDGILESICSSMLSKFFRIRRLQRLVK